MDFRARWMKRAEGFAGQLGLPYRIEQASDPFFGRGGKLMAMSQVEQELKFELLVPVHSEEQPTACMSFNYHRDHFGTTWNLHTASARRRAYRLRRLRHRSAGLGPVRHPRRRSGAMADAGAPSADDLMACTLRNGEKKSNAHNRVFGIGKVAEPRALRTLEIFRLTAAAENSEHTRDRAIGVGDGDGTAAPRQIAADRSGKAGEIEAMSRQ